MESINKFKKFMNNREYRQMVCLYNHLFDFMPDKAYLKRVCQVKLGYSPDLDNPQSFNEKTQFLKLYDRKNEYSKYVDKVEVKQIISKKFGEEYVIPTIGVWDNPEKIDFDALPDKFVLKCNHNSGRGMCICTDKANLKMNQVIKDLKKGLKENYYRSGREYPYKNVKRKVFAEEYIVDESEYELKDYKLFVFSGKVYCIEVDYDRFTNHHRNFYDVEWNYMPFTTLYPTNPDRIITKPSCLSEMIKMAEEISRMIGLPPYVRVDLYVVKNRILFGEITFYHGGGTERFCPQEYDAILGNLIDISHFKM